MTLCGWLSLSVFFPSISYTLNPFRVLFSGIVDLSYCIHLFTVIIIRRFAVNNNNQFINPSRSHD